MSFVETPGRKKRIHAARKPTRTPKTHESTLAERVMRRRRGQDGMPCRALDFNTPAKDVSRRRRRRESYASDESDSENCSRHGDLVRETTPRKLALGSHGLTNLVKDVQKLSLGSGSESEDRGSRPKVVSLAPPNNKGRKRVLRVSRSKKAFDANHELQGPLGNQENYGGGCLVYLSSWQNYPTVTKLMPLHAHNGFTVEENIENAHRETDIHTSAYRLALKKCPMDRCPVAPIWAVTETTFDSTPHLALVMPRFSCNLAEYLHRRGPVQPEVAWRFLRAGVDFLRICLECNFIHHDIKPENIFLTVDEPRGTIRDICFGDYGCSAWTDEEFPFNPITGTVTMWDVESLGPRYGAEDGFCIENDVYGMLGCVLDAVSGYSLLEDKLDDVDPDWEALDWDDYTNLMREWRPRVITRERLHEVVDESFCDKDENLRAIILQLAVPRRQRMDLEQIARLVELYEENMEE